MIEIRININLFLKEREIAIKNGNTNFLTWLDFQIEKYLTEKEGSIAKLNKLREIEFLEGDSRINPKELEKAKNEVLGGLI